MKKLFIFISLFFAFTLYAQHCGTWRWAVKTLTDPEATQIITKTPVTTTISALSKETAPQKLSTAHNFDGRLNGEHDIVRVNALIKEYKLEADHDYHIVLQDPNSNETLVSEIPDPDCDNLKNFPDLQKRFRSLRSWIDSKVLVTTNMTEADPPIVVTIEGVAFWDAPHGATGATDQGREIHPITDIISTNGSIAATFNPPPFIPTEVPDKQNNTGNLNQGNKPMENTPINILVTILLGAILGMVGQGLRVVVGLKKLSDKNAAKTADQKTQFSNQQLVTSLIIAFAIGAIAGVLAALNIINQPSMDKSTIMAFIAAGYAGTDFIEGFMNTNPIQ